MQIKHKPDSFGVSLKTQKNMTQARYTPLLLLSCCRILLLFIFIQLPGTGTFAQVTAIYSDYAGYWTSSSTSINTVKPDNSHNLLAFTWNGTTWSTGVNDAILTSHSVGFTAQSFRAFPINSVPNTTASNYFVMLGQLYDGINNGVGSGSTSPFPGSPSGSQLASYLTDGPKGLDLGTGLANIPAGSVLRFNLSTNGISLSAINDGKPDIFVTEEASPSSSSPDIFTFVDASGSTVGNAVSVVTSGLPQVGNWQADFYDLTGTQTNSTYINQPRPLAYYAADLSTFGITAANYMNVVALVYQPNGTSDPAFIAFSEPSISVSAQLNLTTQPSSYTTSVTLSPAPVVQVLDGLGRAVSQPGIPVTVSVASGTGSLSGTVTVNTDASGVATFSNLNITATGIVTLKFSSTSLNPAVSANLSPIPLPLTWVSLAAQAVKNGILLQWSTAAEFNTKELFIQRSADGEHWLNIGDLPAGSGTGTYDYQYTDNSPGKGVNYYRIMELDLDGKDGYSPIVLVAVKGNPNGLTLFPNPVTNGVLNIRLQQAARVSLYTIGGLPVLTEELTGGQNQLDLHNLPKGIYNLRIEKRSYKIIII